MSIMSLIIHLGRSLFLVLSLILIVQSSCTPKSEKTVVIACASNVQFAMEELCKEFEKENSIKTSIIVASSGKLTAQIIEGAPYDIFVSADLKFPNKVYSEGKGFRKPEIYAYGQLMLISINPAISVDLNFINNEKIKHIAVANPKTAPYGRAAESVLHYYNLYEGLEKKLVYGESVSQTNQFISTGAAEIGFTSYSSLSAFPKPNNYLLIDPDVHSPIEQGAILIKNTAKNDLDAEKFYLFLFSQKAREILIKYGYQLPNNL